ncbi:hypothetical protein TgHK011_008970 [Trichoderma gracile]|nr:hypothetical protein TgHK011_008970 [Trichoderma gracile]
MGRGLADGRLFSRRAGTSDKWDEGPARATINGTIIIISILLLLAAAATTPQQPTSPTKRRHPAYDKSLPGRQHDQGFIRQPSLRAVGRVPRADTQSSTAALFGPSYQGMATSSRQLPKRPFPWSVLLSMDPQQGPRVLDEATAPSDLLRATTPRRCDTQPTLQTPSSTSCRMVAASHQICIAVAIRSVSAGERLCALHLHHGTYMVPWRRADCNSPIGRECWPRPVPEPEHIGWPQDHWTATHQSCCPRRSCQMPLPQRKPTGSSPVKWRDSADGCTREAMPDERWRARPVSRDADARQTQTRTQTQTQGGPWRNEAIATHISATCF